MSRHSSWLHPLALFSLLLLAFSLPFEMERPLIQLGPIGLTNLELVLLATLGLTVLLVVGENRWRQAGWTGFAPSWLILGGLFALALLLAAVFAPDFRQNALKAAFRSGMGLALALATPQLVRRPDERRWLFMALVAGGMVSVLAGLLELAAGAPLSWLTPFREAPTSAGPFMRLTGSFSHANQAAMYIEATLPLLVALLVGFYRRYGATRLFYLLLVLPFIYLEAGILTFSRTSFVAIFLSNVVVAGLVGWHKVGRRPAALWAGLAVAIVPLVVLNLGASSAFRLRLSSETDNEWYQAQIGVPAVLELKAGQSELVDVHISNEGSLLWSSEGNNPILLGGHWYQQPGNRRLSGEYRWPLQQPLAPGAALEQEVSLRAPSVPGEYRFEWDLIQENVVWFSVKNGLHTSSEVTVLPNPNANIEPAAAVETTSSAVIPPIPDRRTLWRAAALLLLDNPLFGIGQDNFRLMHGRVYGWDVWNDTIHTNNWYIETIVSLGLLGSLPFLAWLGSLTVDLIKRVRRPVVPIEQAAVAVGLFAFLIHGLLDYFLAFHATALLFWLLVGLWVSETRKEDR